MAVRREVSPEEILKEQSPEIAALSRRLMQTVREAVPEAHEVGYPGWRAIGYRHPFAGYICGVFPLADRVKVYFEQGRALPDPSGLLKGGGSQTRYAEYVPGGEVPSEALKLLVAESVAFGVFRKGEPRAIERTAR